jgi:hypothetical protein
MKPVNPLDKDIWLRIQDLESCASVKAFSDPNYCGRLIFVPTDSPAGRSSPHPSIFTVVMKRSSGGIKISDCHAFICHSDETAMILVRACGAAYSDKSGWSDERPTLVELGLERPEVKLDSECYVDDQRDDCRPEYYEKPSLSGFFYAPRADLIQKYNIKGEDDSGRPCGENRMIEHFTCEQSCPTPEPHQPQCLPLCERPQNCYVQQIGYNYPGQPMMMMANQQPNLIQPQHAQLYHQENVIQPQQAQLYYGANPGRQDGNHANYMRILPHENLIRAENERRGLGDILPINMFMQDQFHAENRQDALQYGTGDNGPPPRQEDIYSRQLPIGKGGRPVSGYKNIDGNFILRRDPEYKYSAAGGPGGVRLGGIGIGDDIY